MQTVSSCILLVHHDPLMGGLVHRLMETERYQVIEATSEKQALEAFDHCPPDLVLLDIDLPLKEDGLSYQQVSRVARRLQVPILVLTADQDGESIERVFAGGASDCLIKPINPFLLIQTVRRLLASRRMLTELRNQLEREQFLKGMVQRMRNSLDLDNILNRAVEEVRQFLQVDRVLVYRFQPDGSGIVVAESVSAQFLAIQGQAIYDFCLEDYWHELYLGGRISMVEDTHLDPIAPCYARLLPSLQVGANLVVPIAWGDTLWGLLIVQHCAAPRQWHHWEVNLLRQVVAELAIAIQQATLYQAAQTQITESNRLQSLKDDLLSTASHELRGPLANIRLAIQMLEHTVSQYRNHGNLLENQSAQTRIISYLQILKQECDSEIALINDLLDLQRMESGQHTLELSTIGLQTWLPEIAAPFIRRTQKRQQTLAIDLSPDLPSLTSDAACLKRILAELLNNACKYTPDSETITLTVKPVNKAEEWGMKVEKSNPSTLQISVSNTGVEIPANSLCRIFDHFYRVPGGDRWKQGGSGLGLALVKNLVICLGGTIRADSGAGATHFIMELPFQLQTDSSSSS